MFRYFIGAMLAALLCLSPGGCDKKGGKSTDAANANADDATPVQKALMGSWELDRKATAVAKLPTATRPGGVGFQFDADGTGLRRVGLDRADKIRWKTITVDGQSMTVTLAEDKPTGHEWVATFSLISPDKLRVSDAAGIAMLRRTTADVSAPQTDQLYQAMTLAPAASINIAMGQSVRLAVSRDGHWLVARGGTAHGNFTLWDLTTQTQKFAIDESGVAGMPVAISSDGKTFATADYVGASTFDVETGKRIRAFPPKPGQDGLPSALLFGRGQTLIAAAGMNIIGWNTETAEEVFAIPADPTEVSALALFPTGRRIASAGKDNQIHLWDIPEGTKAGKIDPGEGQPTSALAVNIDASYLAAAITGGTIRIFDLPSCAPSRKFRPGNVINTLLFMPDGKTLLYPVHSNDAWDIVMTDVETGMNQATLHGHTALITSMNLTADGNALMSVSDDGTIKTWDLTALNARLQSSREFSR